MKNQRIKNLQAELLFISSECENEGQVWSVDYIDRPLVRTLIDLGEVIHFTDDDGETYLQIAAPDASIFIEKEVVS